MRRVQRFKECAWRGCHLPIAGKFKDSYYCEKHVRFKQMRKWSLKTRGIAPDWEELEELIGDLVDFKCPSCLRKMNWLKTHGWSTTIVLTYLKGQFKVMCKACQHTNEKFGENFYRNIGVENGKEKETI